MTKLNFYEERKLVAKVGAMMLQRNLTDLAGGNISMRVDDKIIMSPTYAGTMQFWQLEPEQVLILDLAGNKLEGDGDISRESTTHLKLLNNFYPRGSAVIHAHPRNILVFCAAEKSIPPVLESTLKFGEIKVAQFAHGGSHCEQLAENIYSELRGQEDLMEKQAAIVIAPWHGVFAIGQDLRKILDAIDRIEANAYCILMSKLLVDPVDMDAHCSALRRASQELPGRGNE
jgi:L-fuculose-phosphate aldolase